MIHIHNIYEYIFLKQKIAYPPEVQPDRGCWWGRRRFIAINAA